MAKTQYSVVNGLFYPTSVLEQSYNTYGTQKVATLQSYGRNGLVIIMLKSRLALF